jgi:hypothetical protein
MASRMCNPPRLDEVRECGGSFIGAMLKEIQQSDCFNLRVGGRELMWDEQLLIPGYVIDAITLRVS